MPNPFSKISSSLTESFRREIGGEKAGSRNTYGLQELSEALPGKSEKFYESAIATHEGGHFAAAIEIDAAVRGVRVSPEGGQVSSSLPSSYTGEELLHAQREIAIAGSAAMAVALGMSNPIRLKGDATDIFQHAKTYDPSVTDLSSITAQHVDTYYEHVAQRMERIAPYRENIVQMGKALYQNPVWAGSEKKAESFGVAAAPMPYSMYQAGQSYANAIGSSWNNRGLYTPEEEITTAFGQMSTPYNAWSASHIGNAIQSFRGLVANELNTSNPASKMATQIGQGLVNNNAAWDIVAQQTGQRFLNYSGPNSNPEYGTAGGLRFGFRRPTITTNSQGEMAAWQVHTFSGSNDTSQASLSAHLHAILSGATHYGVTSVNRDKYQAYLSAGMTPQQALAQPDVISASSPQPVNPNDPRLAAEYSKLSAIQDYSQMANGLSGANIGMRIDNSAPQTLQLQHVDEQLKALSGAINDPSIEQALFGMQLGQGIADPQVANALFLKAQGGAASGQAPVASNTPITPASVVQQSGVSGGLIDLNVPPGSYPSMSVTGGPIRIPTQQPYASSALPSVGVNIQGTAGTPSIIGGVNIPGGNYPSSSMAINWGPASAPPTPPNSGGASGSGNGGWQGPPLGFDASQYHPQLASLGNAVEGLGKVFEDAAKSTMHLTDTQSGYIKQASQLADTLGKGIQAALPAAMSGNQDAMAFLQQAGAGYGKLQGMLGGMGGLQARAMSDMFGSQAPSQVPDADTVFGTFLQGGTSGRKARAQAKAEGWYGDTDAEQMATEAVGHLAAMPQRFLGAHFQLRAITNDIFGPMEDARQQYLQYQQGGAQAALGMQSFGGYGFAGTAAYRQAFLPGALAAQQQLALGGAAQRAYGGLAQAGASAFGTEGFADIQGLVTAGVGGAAAGGLSASILGIGAIAPTIIGGVGGAGAYLAGGTLDFSNNQTDRMKALIGQQSGAFQPIANVELSGARAISAIQQKGLLGAILPGGPRTAGVDTENQKASVAAGVGSDDPARFSAAMQFMLSDPANAASTLPQLINTLAPQIGRLQPAVQQQIAMSLINQYRGGSKADVQAQASALANAAANGLDISSPGSIAGVISSINTGASSMDVRAPGFSAAQMSLDKFLSGTDSVLKAQFLPGAQAQSAAIRDAYRGAGYAIPLGEADVEAKTSALVNASATTTPSGQARTAEQITASVNRVQNMQAMQYQQAQLVNATGVSMAGSDYNNWAMGMMNDTSPQGLRAARQLMNSQMTVVPTMQNYLQYGIGMNAQDAASMGGAVNQGTYMYSNDVAISAGRQASLLGYTSDTSGGGRALATAASRGLGRLMTAGVNTGGLTDFAQYGVNVNQMLGQANASLSASPMQGMLYGQNLAQMAGMAGSAAGLTGAGVSQQSADMYSQIASNPNQAAAQFGMNVLSGNPIASSIYAQANPNQAAIWQNVVQTTGPYQGMQTMYSQVNAQQAAARQAFGASQGYIQPGGAYSASDLSGMSQLQLDKAQYTQQINLRNFDFGQQTRALNRQQAQTIGDWGFEDTGIQLQRTQQDYSYQQQGKQLALQGQQMQFEYGHQQQEASISFQHQQTQSGWQLQNLQYQQNVSDLQYGFSMMDADESVRYSTGRARRDAMRHRDEATIMHSVEAGQNTTEQGRVKQQEEWAKEQFDRDKSYAAQEQQFKQKNFELSVQDYNKQREFTLEQRKLDDEKRQFDRNIAKEDMADAQLNLKVHQEATKTMDNLAAAQRVANELTNQWTSHLQFAGQTLGYTNSQMASLIAYLQQLGSVASSSSSGSPNPQYGGTTITYTPPVQGSPYIPTQHIGDAGYAVGGFTGYGPKMQAAGTAHKGEWIIPQEGSPVVQSPEHIQALQNIHSVMKDVLTVLKQIQRGGNAIVNINQTNATTARNQALSLLGQAYS